MSDKIKLMFVLLLVLALFLIDYDRDFATLDFDRPVTFANQQDNVRLIYREQLDDLLLAQGISPDRVQLRTEQGGKQLVLTTPLFKGVSEEEARALQQALQQIIDRRQQKIRAVFQPQTASVSGLPAGTPLPTDEIRMDFHPSQLFVRSQKRAEQDQADIYCEIRLWNSRSLPYQALEQDDDGLHFLYRTSAASLLTVPVRVTTDNTALNQLLAGGELHWGSATPPSGGRGADNVLRHPVLLFGPVSRATLNPRGGVNLSRLHQLEPVCQDHIARMGLPLSRYLGENLHRLTAVRMY